MRLDESASLNWARIVLISIGVIITSNAPSVTISRQLEMGLDWEQWPFLGLFGIVSMAGLILAGREVRITKMGPAVVPIVAVAALATWSFASMWWSVVPVITTIRATTGVGIAAFGIWVGATARIREVVMGLFISSALLTAASTVVSFADPAFYRITEYSNQLPLGLFANPNSLGPIAALLVLSSFGVTVMFKATTVRVLAVCGILLGLSLTAWSRSETAIGGLVIAAAGLAALPLLPLLRRWSGRKVALVVGLSAATIAVSFYLNLDRVADLVGFDPTFSSRRLIWQDVREAISLRPWRGYGYFAFWNDEDLTRTTYERIGHPYGSAHNSLLETTLGMGGIGLLCYLVLIAATVTGACRALWRETTTASVFVSLLAIFIYSQNMTESFVLWHSYNWMLSVAIGVLVLRPGFFEADRIPVGRATGTPIHLPV